MGNTLSGKYSMDMCTGSVLKKMLRFALPLMLSGILQLLFNAADIIVVGNFAGDESLAAVGATTTLINLMTNLFIGLSVGVNVLTANYFGAGKADEVKATVHTAMSLSVISGVFLTVVGIVFAPSILHLMKVPDDVIGLSVIYLRTYFAGMIAVMVYNFGSAVLRAVGDTRRSLYFLTASGVVNVVLNLIFVIVFRWGVFGVGLATAISQAVSAALVVITLMKEKSAIRLSLSRLRIDRHKLLRIVQIGLPAGLQGMLFSISNLLIQSSVNSFGKIIIAGNSASANVEGFAFTAMNAFHQGAVAFMGQNKGAGRYDRLGKVLSTSLAYVFATGLIFAVIYNVFSYELIDLYTNSDEVISAGVTRLTIIATAYFLAGMMDVVVGAIRGLGYSVVPMIVSVFGICIFRVFWIFCIFSQEAYHTIESIYFSYPVSWILTLSVQLLCYFYIKIKVIDKKRKITR
ncbi:MAG: MATE family efflux transporter [Ruminococcaceae bacterium]|nr:MATE family efflux transporter [Oscillospiraceae bacterium]